MPSILPLEIEEIILDSLHEDDDESHSALKTCSLVCHAFLPICRKHVFGNIVLHNYNKTAYSSSTLAFERLLHETPKIADYIRKLDFNVQFMDLTSSSIQESLKRVSRLEFLRVSTHPDCSRIDWSSNLIRPALLHLLHLPTLTHFEMTRIGNFVVSDLIPCVNLKYLDIGNSTTVADENILPASFPEHPIQPNKFVADFESSAVIMKLCTARRPDGQPIIDFGSLSKIAVKIEDPDDGEASQELFKRCHVLTFVHIYFSDPRNARPSIADMLRPSMQTLKHIVVITEVDGDDVDPLSGIPSELEIMRTKNIIETITIKLLVDLETDADCCQADDWGRLDQVLTTSGWFLLKQVSLAIQICSYYRRSDELEVALRNLPETQFPRLSSSNSISFDFETNTVYDLAD